MSLSVFTRNNQNGQAASAPTPTDLVAFTGDASYPTGGYPGVTAALQKMSNDGRTPLAFVSQDCGGYFAVYVPSTDKLKVYWCGGSGAAMSEVTNATDLHLITFNGLFISV